MTKLIINLTVAALGALSFAMGNLCVAQEFPSKPVHVILGLTAGGLPDVMTRHITARLSARTGWSILIDYRPGGNYVPAINAMMQSPSDGHTVLLSVMSLTMFPFTNKDYPFDARKDLMPIVRVANTPIMIVANASVPARNLAELVAYSKANPGKLSFGGVGTGATSQLTAELLKLRTGLDVTYVSYKGGEYALDLIAGRLHLAHISPSFVEQAIQEGKLRGIIYMGASRFRTLPDVPTAIEATGDADFDINSWYGFFVRAGTPKDITDRLERELVAVLRLPDTRVQLEKLSLDPVVDSSEAFARRIDADMRRWDKVVRDAKLKFD